MMRYIKILFGLLPMLFISCNEDDVTETDNSTRTPTEIIGVLNDTFEGEDFVVYANSKNRILTAFTRRTVDGTEIANFEKSDIPFPVILKDTQGNEYDINGRRVDLPDDDGKALERVDHIVGYWFFFTSIFKSVDIYEGDSFENSEYEPSKNEWLLNTDYVFSGSFQDGIQSIDNPDYRKLQGRELIQDPFYSSLNQDELFTIVQKGNTIHAIPHRILEYHEVLNDEIEGNPIVVSYCPLTGTSLAWEREIDGEIVEFGVSGLLYNNNLILYDRKSESRWSQVLSQSVNGEYIGREAKEVHVFETRLENVTKLKGDIYYLTTNTGVNFNYQESLYPSYKTNDQISFPLSNLQDIIPLKERVIGVKNGSNVKVYRFEDFAE